MKYNDAKKFRSKIMIERENNIEKKDKREILFKAKRIDNGQWVEGYYAKLGCGKKSKHFIIQNVCLDENNMYFYDIEIDINTLCQYTGVNDNTHWEGLTESEKESFLSNWNYKENRKNEIGDWKGRKIWEFVGGEIINEST